MSEKKIINETLIENIKYLMERSNESPEDLYYELGYNDPSTIRKYLNGARAVNDDAIKKLAIHYRVTKELLINYNLKEFYKDVEEGYEPIDFFTIFRIPYFEDDITKNELKKPFSYIDKFFKTCLSENPDFDSLEKGVNEFEKIYKNNNDADAIIWWIWCYIIIEHFGSFNIDEGDQEADVKKKMNTYSLVDNGINYSFNDELDTTKFYEYCSSLKHSKWNDLVYYYMTLRFVNGYGNSAYDIEVNKKIGVAMMAELCKIGNEYANDFVSYSTLFFNEDVMKGHK